RFRSARAGRLLPCVPEGGVGPGTGAGFAGGAAQPRLAGSGGGAARLPAGTLRRDPEPARAATLVGLAPQEDREVAAGYKVQVRNPTKASSRSGKAKPRNFGCFMRERAANDAPRCTRA